MTTDSSSKHAVLVLHGYGMSAASIMNKTGALRSEVKKFPFEFIGLDGPFDCITQAPLPPQPKTEVEEDGNNDDNQQQRNRKVNLPANLTLEPGARAWYSFQNVDSTGRYERFEEGFNYIVNHCAERDKQGLPPYRGVFAFSQGTIMASMLAARVAAARNQQLKHATATETTTTTEQEGKSSLTLQSSSLLPPFMTHLEFVVLVSGLLPKDSSVRNEIVTSLKENNISSGSKISSLHIIGTSDRLVDPEHSRELAKAFSSNGEVEVEVWEHDGGHVIPSQARKPFKAFLEKLLAEKGRF
jgi:hypothetical protein